MYVTSRKKSSKLRNALRFVAWKSGDAIASVISAATRFEVPNEPLQPFAQKLPMLLGTYEVEVQRAFASVVQPGMVILDAGAHVGFFTRCLSRAVGSEGMVVALEIDETNLRMLRRNVGHLRNVKVVHAGLADQPGMAVVRTSKLSSGHTIAEGKPGDFSSGNSVPLMSVASLLDHIGVGRFDVIKMDIEGSEPAVIASIERDLPQMNPVLVFEVKDYILAAAGASSIKVLRNLQERGYDIAIIDKAGLIAPDLGENAKPIEKANIIARVIRSS